MAELWCVNITGPDDVLAMPDYLSAVKVANAINAQYARHVETRVPRDSENWPRCWAVPIIWCWSAEAHAEDLAEPSADYASLIRHALHPVPA